MKKRLPLSKHNILLLTVILIAIFVRSLPAWTNAAWGGDLGIYYGIALRIIEKNDLFVNYDGWGNSYQYFPLLYVISIAIHLLTGFDLLKVMIKIAPIIGGLTTLLLYLISLEITKNKKISLISSALLAVAPFHVYQTSHAAPLTMGHFFMLLSILLFLKYEKKRKIYIFPLIISTIILILSHHLTTYFYLIVIAGMILWRNFKFDIPRKENLLSFGYLFLTSIMTFSYWRFWAKPVYFSFMKNGIFNIEPIYVIASYFLTIILSYFILKLLKKGMLSSLLKKISQRWMKNPVKLIYFSIFSLLLIESIFMFLNLPATNIRMNPVAMLLSIPTVIFVSLSVAGIPFLSTGNRRSYVQGWLLAISLSLLYSLITSNTTLYPDRHIEYLMVPMCISSSFGIIEIGRRAEFTLYRVLRKKFHRFSTEVVVASIVLAVIFSNSITVYPSRESLGNLDERFSQPCLSAIEWLKNNIYPNDTIATDLRLSDFVWAYGMKATFDTTSITWTCEDWRECLIELEKNQHHDRVTYILIDDIMRNNVIYLGVFLSVYMTNQSYEKFKKEPFELVYRNSTLDSLGNEIHWAEVYKVNWSYIENYTNFS